MQFKFEHRFLALTMCISSFPVLISDLHPALHDVLRLPVLALQPRLVPGGRSVGHEEDHLDPPPLLQLSHPLSPAVPERPVPWSTGDHDQHPVTDITGGRGQEEADIPLQ